MAVALPAKQRTSLSVSHCLLSPSLLRSRLSLPSLSLSHPAVAPPHPAAPADESKCDGAADLGGGDVEEVIADASKGSAEVRLAARIVSSALAEASLVSQWWWCGARACVLVAMYVCRVGVCVCVAWLCAAMAVYVCGSTCCGNRVRACM
jgi:hypothetical protein